MFLGPIHVLIPELETWNQEGPLQAPYSRVIQVKQIHGLIERKQNEDAASMRVTSEAPDGNG